jgi:hypothetical protein
MEALGTKLQSFVTLHPCPLTFSNSHFVNLIAIGQGLDHVLAAGDLTKDSVAAIEVGLGGVTDEELGAVSVGAGVGHAQAAALVAVGVAGKLILKAVARTPPAIALGTAALRHKTWDDPVEAETVVKFVSAEKDKVVNSFGGISRKQIEFDSAFGGVKGGLILLLKINHHIGIAVILFHKILLNFNVE